MPPSHETCFNGILVISSNGLNWAVSCAFWTGPPHATTVRSRADAVDDRPNTVATSKTAFDTLPLISSSLALLMCRITFESERAAILGVPAYLDLLPRGHVATTVEVVRDFHDESALVTESEPDPNVVPMVGQLSHRRLEDIVGRAGRRI